VWLLGYSYESSPNQINSSFTKKTFSYGNLQPSRFGWNHHDSDLMHDDLVDDDHETVTDSAQIDVTFRGSDLHAFCLSFHKKS
jgi:hypothetical protein